MIHGIAHDIRFALRLLLHDRWLSLAAVLALALGIAVNTAVFTIVNALLFRELPFDEPDRIVSISTAPAGSPRATAGVSLPDLTDWRSAVRAFDGLGAASERTMNVSDESGAPARFVGTYISTGSFELLRRAPALGRTFTADDDHTGANPVVILGYTIWRDRYQADPAIIGRTIRVNGVPSTVIGVMPEGFGFPARSRLWQPLALMPSATLNDRSQRVLEGFGRLAAGFTIDQARADVGGAAGTLASHYSATCLCGAHHWLDPTRVP